MKTGVSLFDIEIGGFFTFSYDPKSSYRLMGFTDGGNHAVIRAQRAGARDENCNPYYDDIIRKDIPK